MLNNAKQRERPFISADPELTGDHESHTITFQIQDSQIPQPWNMAYFSMVRGTVGTVESTTGSRTH